MANVIRLFKTPKGTDLPLINLKGKEYLQVAHRLQWFIEETPKYDIKTDFLTLNEEKAVAHVTIVIFDDKNQINRKVMATKSETLKGFPDFIEKAQTGALGRALSMLGFGTQFTSDELDEGERIVDAPLENNIRKVAPFRVKKNNDDI